MILWLGLGAGLVTGLGLSKWRRQPYSSPKLTHIWLILVGFLPQFLVVYLGSNHAAIPDWLAALSILASQLFLFFFVWLNRHVTGMPILIAGLLLNLVVMVTNGGFMPINPEIAGRVIGAEKIASFEFGSRIGYKDILLPATNTRLEWLADRFLPPAWFPYQVAFSLGDVFIAIGAFRILAFQNTNT